MVNNLKRRISKMNKFELIQPENKIERGILPYVTFPIINKCNLKCQYCGNFEFPHFFR